MRLPNEVAISAMFRAICLNLAMLLAVANFMASNKSEAVLKCRLGWPGLAASVTHRRRSSGLGPGTPHQHVVKS